MYGYARPTAPFVGVSSSGFVVMRREMLGDPQFKDTLTHEFFHVLQQARNARLTFNWDIRPDDDPEWDTLVFAKPWWVEGTAEWAGFRFTRDLPGQDSTRLIGHHQRFSYFLSYSSHIPCTRHSNEGSWLGIHVLDLHLVPLHGAGDRSRSGCRDLERICGSRSKRHRAGNGHH
jgi:hypothetical protein